MRAYWKNKIWRYWRVNKRRQIMEENQNLKKRNGTEWNFPFVWLLAYNFSGLQNQRAEFKATTPTRQYNKSPKIEKVEVGFCMSDPPNSLGAHWTLYAWADTKQPTKDFSIYAAKESTAHQRFKKLNWDLSCHSGNTVLWIQSRNLPAKTKIAALFRAIEMIHNATFTMSGN